MAKQAEMDAETFNRYKEKFEKEKVRAAERAAARKEKK